MTRSHFLENIQQPCVAAQIDPNGKKIQMRQVVRRGVIASQVVTNLIGHVATTSTVPRVVTSTRVVEKRDDTSETYLKVLRVYLTALKRSFCCQLRTVTSGQIADNLRGLEVFPRSKNNAHATIGAFFKFCKERGWLSRDHEGLSLVRSSRRSQLTSQSSHRGKLCSFNAF
ncbi:MAG: hypothetical protein NTZ16_14385 [Verrucomicrobia bacterium]|nr:hypothetical protein [Verrucomicrobiota bacterium]